MDHGSGFVAHRINKDGSWESEFKRRIGENMDKRKKSFKAKLVQDKTIKKSINKEIKK